MKNQVSPALLARDALVARVVMLAATAATVVMTTRTLGVSGQGDWALLQFGLLLVTGFSGYVAGGAVVYVRKFFAARHMVPLAVTGIAVSMGLGMGVGQITGWVPSHWRWEAMWLGGLQAAVVLMSQLVLAAGMVRFFHATQALQVVMMAVIWALFVAAGDATLDDFVVALRVSLMVTLALLLWGHRNVWSENAQGEESQRARNRRGAPRSLTSLMLVKGAEGQTGSLLQLWTNRLNISQLERFVSLDASGLYALGYYALEAVWIVGRAWSPAVHAQSAAETDDGRRKAHTVWHVKRVVALSGLSAVVMACVPDSLWSLVFRVQGLQTVLQSLTVAMVAGSVATLISHHLSGVGLHRWNAVTSGLGFLVLWGCSTLWIPGTHSAVDGATMAGWALSASSAVQCAGLLLVFIQTTKSS